MLFTSYFFVNLLCTQYGSSTRKSHFFAFKDGTAENRYDDELVGKRRKAQRSWEINHCSTQGGTLRLLLLPHVSRPS